MLAEEEEDDFLGVLAEDEEDEEDERRRLEVDDERRAPVSDSRMVAASLAILKALISPCCYLVLLLLLYAFFLVSFSFLHCFFLALFNGFCLFRKFWFCRLHFFFSFFLLPELFDAALAHSPPFQHAPSTFACEVCLVFVEIEFEVSPVYFFLELFCDFVDPVCSALSFVLSFVLNQLPDVLL